MTQTEKLASLIAQARKIEMGPSEQRIQRKSFVYGNTHIENSYVTRSIVDTADKNVIEKNKK